MCLDILEKEEIITYREKERDFLLSIRNGKYQKEDGTYKMEFFDLVTELENRVNYAAKHTRLPEEPDYHKINQLLIEINKEVVQGE